MSHKIILTQGYFTLIDECDLEKVKNIFFSASKSKNAKHQVHAVTNINGRLTKLTHILYNPPKGMVVDHINGNTLDNRSANIRICTQGQNLKNQHKWQKKKNGVKYKGVSKTNNGRFVARIFNEGKNEFLGVFDTQKEAAVAYDKKAIELHGDFASVNFGGVEQVSCESFFDPNLLAKEKLYLKEEEVEIIKSTTTRPIKQIESEYGISGTTVMKYRNILGVKLDYRYENTETGKRYMYLKDIAEDFNVTTNKIYRMLANRRIPIIAIKGKLAAA